MRAGGGREKLCRIGISLPEDRTLAVILVQGPGQVPRTIADEMISRRGVSIGKLLLSAAILPPVHPLPGTGAIQRGERDET